MNFIIPNSNTPGDLETIVRVQLVFHGVGLSPIVSVKYPTDVEVSDNDVEPVLVSSGTVLPRSWKHVVMSFRLQGCPRYSSIFIYPPDRADVFIDSIAIDTICTDNADSILEQ